jgi:hypothetical protein
MPSVVDDFDDGDLLEYTDNTGAISISSTQAHNSSAYSLLADGWADGRVYNQDETFSPKRGQIFELYVYPTSTGVYTSIGWPYHGHANGGSAYELYFDSGGFDIARQVDGTRSFLASGDISGLTIDAWNRVEVAWKRDGTITVDLYDDTGTNVESVSATDTTYNHAVGGVFYESLGGDPFYVDTWQTLGTTDDFTILDSFEDGDISEYTGDTGDWSVAQDGDSYHDGHRLEMGGSFGDSIIISTSGLDYYPSQGDTFGTWCKTPYQNSRHHMFLFGVQDSSNYYEVRYNTVVGGTNEILINKVEGGSSTTLASTTQVDPTFGKYENIEVAWGTDGSIDVTIYNVGAGAADHATLSATDTTFTSGGIGFGADYSSEDPDGIFDLLYLEGSVGGATVSESSGLVSTISSSSSVSAASAAAASAIQATVTPTTNVTNAVGTAANPTLAATVSTTSSETGKSAESASTSASLSTSSAEIGSATESTDLVASFAPGSTASAAASVASSLLIDAATSAAESTAVGEFETTSLDISASTSSSVSLATAAANTSLLMDFEAATAEVGVGTEGAALGFSASADSSVDAAAASDTASLDVSISSGGGVDFASASENTSMQVQLSVAGTESGSASEASDLTITITADSASSVFQVLDTIPLESVYSLEIDLASAKALTEALGSEFDLEEILNSKGENQ